jgi:hypothetical protein
VNVDGLLHGVLERSKASATSIQGHRIFGHAKSHRANISNVAVANMDKAVNIDSRCHPVSTQIFTERAINPKFDGISTEEMVRELIDRKKAHVDQLSALVELVGEPSVPRARAKSAESARPLPALPPATKASASSPTVPAGASLNERIVAVLLSSEGRGLTSREITERLLADGWTTKATKKGKLVVTAISAMVGKKALKRSGDRVMLPSGRDEPAAPAKTSAPAKKKQKKSAATKSAAPAAKRKAPARPPAGKQVADFVLAALKDAGEPSKPAELMTRMKRAGWTSTAKHAEKMVENVLRKLVAKKKAKSLGSRTFQATGG